MGRFDSLQNNGTAGELSPRLARTDLTKYSNGYRLIKNAYPIPQGAQTRRPGTRYLVTSNNNGVKKSRLIPFVASDASVYGLEFAENVIRILDKTTGVLTTVVTTYTEAELFEISYAQSADVMYLAHGNHKPAALAHFSAMTWTLTDLVQDDGPYQPQNTTKTALLTAAATTGTNIAITASGTGNTPFTADDVGKPIRLRHGTTTLTWGWATIKTYTDSTHIHVDIDPDYPFGDTTATAVWRVGEWSAGRGYPSVVAFQEDRICFASTASNPITIWASQSNGYGPTTILYGPTASDGTVTAANSITEPLAQKDIQKIIWMSPGPSMAVGTISAEWLVEAAATTEAWSPTNSRATVQTTRGSQPNTAGIRIETSVLFVQQKGQKLREFTFNFQKNANESNDMMLLADHIALDGIVELVYVQDPHSYLVARLNTGELRFMTYIGQEDVGGWSRQLIGGSYNGGNPIVESIMVLPDYDLGYDALWLVVKRTIAGDTVRYIEIMQPPFYQGDLSEAWFLDAAIQTIGSGLTEIAGLDHLEGENVGVYADGATRPNEDCDFGTIGLDSPANTVLVGYKYSSNLTTLTMDHAGGHATQLGTSLGKFQKIASVDLHVYETGQGVLIGTTPDQMDPLELRFLDSLTDTAPSLYTGWTKFPLGGVYAKETVLYFTVEDPVPFTLLEYSPRGNVNEN